MVSLDPWLGGSLVRTLAFVLRKIQNETDLRCTIHSPLGAEHLQSPRVIETVGHRSVGFQLSQVLYDLRVDQCTLGVFLLRKINSMDNSCCTLRTTRLPSRNKP